MYKRINIICEQGEIPFLYDNEIAKNIYYVYYNKSINLNINNFDIKIQLPENKKSVGIKLSKIKNISIVTICFPNKDQLQFMVTKESNKLDIIKYVLIKEFHDVLIKAIDLAKIDTLYDLLNMKE
jgi:hypothetical protein